MDLLWKKVSEKEKADIEKQARQLLDKFSKRLSKLDLKPVRKHIKEKVFDRPEGLEKPELDRDIMFSNAPNKNKDSIIAEKKEW